MKRFTKLFMTLALLCVAGSVSAQEEVHATFANPTGITWDADNMEFSWTSSTGNQLHNIGLPNGNITEYETLVIDCDIIEGSGYRFMFYATNKGTTAGGVQIITESGKKEYKLSDFNMDADYLTQCSEICLSGYNGSGKVKVNDVYLIKANDPLAVAKKLLMDAITLGNNQSAYAKTQESFQNLTNAISEGQSEYENINHTAASLEAAQTAIENAITNLKLEKGYTTLTPDMFKTWDDAINPTSSSNTKPYCAYDLNNYTGQPYGDPSVNWKNFAELSTYSSLILVAPSGTPRFMFNRKTDGGNDNKDETLSNLIDINNNTWGNPDAEISWCKRYQNIEGTVFTIDLPSIVTDKGYARLNAIKGSNGNVTVTDMLLYCTLTISGAGWATFGSLDKSANLDGANVYAAKYENGSVKLTAVDSKNVPAGVGVLVEGEGEIVPTFDVEADEVESDLKVSNGTVTGDGSTIYVLAKEDAYGVGFYKLAEGTKVPAGKAYLVVSAGSAREFIGFGDATAIKNMETVKANGTVYNLAGQQVKNAQKGVFIVNGKKIVK